MSRRTEGDTKTVTSGPQPLLPLPVTLAELESHLWEAISTDPMLQRFETDYRWLTQVYVSVQPTSGTGKLVWHALGAKTIELIHQNVHVEAEMRSLRSH